MANFTLRSADAINNTLSISLVGKRDLNFENRVQLFNNIRGEISQKYDLMFTTESLYATQSGNDDKNIVRISGIYPAPSNTPDSILNYKIKIYAKSNLLPNKN